LTHRGDRAQAGRTNSENRKARETAEEEAEKIARERLGGFPIDRKAVMDSELFGDFRTTAKMLRLFVAYPAFVKGQLAEDPSSYALGDRTERGAFLMEAVVRECREILDRDRGKLTPEQFQAFEGVLSLWEEGYADPGFRKRLRGEGVE